MVNILSRYIIFTIIKFTLLVLVVVLGVDFFILFIGEFGDMGHGNYFLLQALNFVLLSLPMGLYSLFPMIALLGSLIGLGLLASNYELVVMRTSGVSVWCIVRSVLIAAFILTLFVTVLGEVVAPITQQLANHEKVLAESSGQAAESSGGIWFRSHGSFINVAHIDKGKRLEGVTEYAFNDHHELVFALLAKEGRQKDHHWYLYDVKVSHFSVDGVKLEAIPVMAWPVSLDPHLLGVSRDAASEMNLTQLGHALLFRKHSGLANASYALTFWKRLLQPVATLLMILLAVPFVFGPLRSVSMGFRIVSGAVLGLIFYLLNQFFGPISLVYQLPPVLGASLPILLFGVLAIFLLRRVK